MQAKISFSFAGAALAALLMVSSCTKQDLAPVTEQDGENTVGGTATYSLRFKPDNALSSKTLLAPKALFKNTATGESFTVAGKEGLPSIEARLPTGTYSVEVSAYIEDQVNGKTMHRRVSATQPSFKSAEQPAVSLTPSSNPYADFKIEEIFFTGTASNVRDQYFRIRNTAGVPVIADGLVITEGSFVNTTFRAYNPDLYNTHFAIHAIYQIPGDGTENVVESGASLVIADQAADHTQYNPNSRDLSIADFEWYDEGNYDIDYPAPNLTKIFSIVPKWSINNRGYKSLAIGHLPTSVNEYLNKHKYNATYTNAGGQRDFTTAYSFPLEWIADGVNLLPKNSHTPPNSRLWLHHSVDASYTDLKKDILFPYDKSLIRKRDALNKIVDTDNSAQDFYVDLPSIY